MSDEREEKVEFGDARQFGEIIRKQRKKIGLRIDDAALLCGVSVALLSGLENGSRPVGLPKALHVARQLGVSLFAEPKQTANPNG
ncbi:MAG TPA: helix-turn-helix transcriptional regulator [Gallionella sp.]|nr:helix-turn-helix transcriptional regulator [Gallionella sp.]